MKTTLLNVLAHRASGDVEGSILYGGRPLGRREIRRLLGYVHQHDEFYAHLTVRETLQVDHASCEVPRLEWSLH